MAVLNFPSQPKDGELYPDPRVDGVKQWAWDNTKGTWVSVGEGVLEVRSYSPVKIDGSQELPIVGMPAATEVDGGYMTAADKAKLDALPDPSSVSQPPAAWARLDDISPLFNGIKVNFTLTVNGVQVAPPSTSSLMIVMNAETLTPYEDYQVAGSEIFFTTAPHSEWTFSGVALI